MPSLKTTYSILFERFIPKDATKIAGKVEARQKVIEADKQRKFGILLGKKSTEETAQTSLKKYMEKYDVLPELGQYLFGSSFTPGKPEAWHSEAQQAFQRMNQEYRYFGQNSAKQAQVLYLDCYKFCIYQAQFVEYNDQPAHEVNQRAYNMLVFFGSVWSGEEEVKKSEGKTDDNIEIISTIENLEKFISRYMHGSQSPIHDLFIHRLPIHDPDNHYFKFQVWRAKILETLGYEAIQQFSDAPKIARYIAEQRTKGEVVDDVDPIDNIPSNPGSFHAILMKCAYSRASENPDLARLFKFYGTPEDAYNKTLKLMEDGTLKVDATGKLLAPKREDHIPDVTVSIAEGKYYLVKLPSHDLRSLILGQITNCCQSIGNFGEDCAIDGVNLAHNGFYVFIKAGRDLNPSNIDWNNFEIRDGRETGNKIIGQSYAWIGSDNSLTLDSIEALGSFKAELDIQKTLEKFGNEILKENHNISRVMLGTSGGTSMVLEANNYKANKSNAPSYPKEGSSYDSNEQFEVYISSPLKQARSNLSEIMHVAQDHIVSVAHANLIMSLGVPYLKLLSGSYHYNKWTSFAITSTCQDAPQLLARHKYLGTLQCKDPTLYKGIFENEKIKEGLSKGYITFEDLIAAGTKQYQLLVSEAAFALYELGVTGKDLLGANSEITERNILKNLAEKLCLEQKETLQYIDSLEADVVQRLINYSATELYKNYNTKVVDLASISSEVFEALSSYYAIEAYKTRQVTFNDLKNLEAKKIEILTGYQVIEAYKSGTISFQDLKDLSVEIIEALTGYQAMMVFKRELVKFSELKDLDKKLIEALTSEAAVILYDTGQANVTTLKELPHAFLSVYTSRVAWWLYREKHVSLADLIALDIDKVTALISQDAINAYSTGKVTFKDLRDLSLDQIKLLISQEACNAYCFIKNINFYDLIDVDISLIKNLSDGGVVATLNDGYVTISDLKNCDERKIKVLTSPYAREVYKMKEASFHNLKDLSKEQITSLTSQNAIEAYKTGKVSFQDLKDLSIPFIKALTEGAYYAYQSGFVHFVDLKDLSKGQITSLTSREAISAYETGKVTIGDLKNLSPEQIISLTDYPAITAYKLGINVESLVGGNQEIINQNILKNLAALFFKESRKTFEYIESLSTDKIRNLILNNIEEGYNDYKMPTATLKNLSFESDNDAEKLKALLSYSAIEIYKAGYYTAADLSTLPLEQILALTSSDSFRTYKTVQLTPEDFEYLKSAPVEYIKALTNHQCREAYQSKLITFGDLTNLAPWQVPLVTSYSAIEGYKEGKLTMSDLQDLSFKEIQPFQHSGRGGTDYRFSSQDIRKLINCRGLDAETIEALYSREAEYAYSSGYVQPSDLRNCTPELIGLLISSPMIEIYKSALAKPSDFVGRSIEQIKFLTSYNMMRIYETTSFKPSDFVGCTQKQIELLTSYKMMEIYKTTLVKPSDLVGCSIEQTEALTDYSPREAYKTGFIKISDLIGLSVEQINALTYPLVLKAFNSGLVSVNDLRHCNKDQIDILTSNELLEVYQTGKIKPSDITMLPPDKILAVVSCFAMMAYSTGKVTIHELSQYNIDQIYALISPDAIRCYQLGYGIYDLLGETSDEINSNIQEVASCVDFTENISEADSSHEEKSEPISVHIVGEVPYE